MTVIACAGAGAAAVTQTGTESRQLRVRTLDKSAALLSVRQLSALRQNGGRFDLDHVAWISKCGDLNCGARGRRGLVEVILTHLAQRRKLRRNIGEIAIELDDVLETGASGRQSNLEILEHLGRLRAKTLWHPSAGIDTSLACDMVTSTTWL